MFKRQKVPQLSIYDFITPFGGHLNGENRWVITAEKMDWDYIDEVMRINGLHSEKIRAGKYLSLPYYT